ncbi:hypothetical protein ACL1GE_10825 [Corynebacterium striatum]
MAADYLSQHHAGFRVSTKQGPGPKWGLMSATERKQSAGIVTRKALEKSLPDDDVELKKLAARLSAEKAVLEKELEELKKRRQHRPSQPQ